MIGGICCTIESRREVVSRGTGLWAPMRQASNRKGGVDSSKCKGPYGRRKMCDVSTTVRRSMPAGIVASGRMLCFLMGLKLCLVALATLGFSVAAKAESDASSIASSRVASNETIIAVAKITQAVVVNVFTTREVKEGEETELGESPLF